MEAAISLGLDEIMALDPASRCLVARHLGEIANTLNPKPDEVAQDRVDAIQTILLHEVSWPTGQAAKRNIIEGRLRHCGVRPDFFPVQLFTDTLQM